MEVAEPMFPSTYVVAGELECGIHAGRRGGADHQSMFWFCPSIKRFDEALTPREEEDRACCGRRASNHYVTG